ncbi:MAG: hypothetical protein WDM70_05200 [Nitrosomonadales bacterium]
MVFLPEQVSEYDKKRMQTAHAPQMEMFIADERSAIDWLSDFLKKKPSTYQEIHPEFIKQLGAAGRSTRPSRNSRNSWKATSIAMTPKPRMVLKSPRRFTAISRRTGRSSAILDKSDPRLKAKATDRWYVPDPNKARDLEMIRDKALLKEFETYRAFSGRRLKTFRLEAMRTGFKTAWANKDYATIIAVAQKVPEGSAARGRKNFCCGMTKRSLAWRPVPDGCCRCNWYRRLVLAFAPPVAVPSC